MVQLQQNRSGGKVGCRSGRGAGKIQGAGGTVPAQTLDQQSEGVCGSQHAEYHLEGEEDFGDLRSGQFWDLTIIYKVMGKCSYAILFRKYVWERAIYLKIFLH